MDLTTAQQIIREVEGTVAGDPVKTVDARIRHISRQDQHGHVPGLRYVYIGKDYCTYHWDQRKHFYLGVGKTTLTHEEWIECSQRLKEYREALQVVETAKEWREVDRIYFADNSVEVIEESNAGERRQRMVTAPHGDVCF